MSNDRSQKRWIRGGAGRPFALVVALVCLLSSAAPLRADSLTEGLAAKWNEGSTDCAKNPGPVLEMHHYDARTVILREGLCTTGEAPFMYLLIGTKKALLIDTGDVEDPQKVALATAVLAQLPADGAAKLPLLVAHTHRHQDHRAGDQQFATLPNTQVIGFDLDSVKKFYHFSDWPNGSAQIDLGDRTVDVIPTPGHNETEVSFYDRNSALVFSGDFLLPARILVDDTDAYRLSTARLIQFLHDRPVTAFLGGHVEKNANGQLFDWQSPYHPDERILQLTPADLQALSVALGHFNGFYTEYGEFTMENSIRVLIAVALAAALILTVVVWQGVRYIRRYRRRRTSATAAKA
jgi:hydroxyacylglutathione hydrolase